MAFAEAKLTPEQIGRLRLQSYADEIDKKIVAALDELGPLLSDEQLRLSNPGLRWIALRFIRFVAIFSTGVGELERDLDWHASILIFPEHHNRNRIRSCWAARPRTRPKAVYAPRTRFSFDRSVGGAISDNVLSALNPNLEIACSTALAVSF